MSFTLAPGNVFTNTLRFELLRNFEGFINFNIESPSIATSTRLPDCFDELSPGLCPFAFPEDFLLGDTGCLNLSTLERRRIT